MSVKGDGVGRGAGGRSLGHAVESISCWFYNPR
jgi:hypothetical protein